MEKQSVLANTPLEDLNYSFADYVKKKEKGACLSYER